MRLDPVHFSMLVIGVSFACYAPSLNSLQDQAYRSAVVIEGEVRSSPENVSSREPYSVNVKVLDVWPVNSGGLEREQLVTVGDFGSEAPCTTVEKDHRYIFFMDPTAEPFVFKASYAPVDASEPELKKDVERVLCEDCGKFKAFPSTCHPLTPHYKGHWSCHGDVRRLSPLSGCACTCVVYTICQPCIHTCMRASRLTPRSSITRSPIMK